MTSWKIWLIYSILCYIIIDLPFGHFFIFNIDPFKASPCISRWNISIENNIFLIDKKFLNKFLAIPHLNFVPFFHFSFRCLINFLISFLISQFFWWGLQNGSSLVIFCSPLFLHFMITILQPSSTESLTILANISIANIPAISIPTRGPSYRE